MKVSPDMQNKKYQNEIFKEQFPLAARSEFLKCATTCRSSDLLKENIWFCKMGVLYYKMAQRSVTSPETPSLKPLDDITDKEVHSSSNYTLLPECYEFILLVLQLSIRE